MSKEAYVYILASKKIGTLYIGVTNDLIRRMWEHKSNQIEGFTKTYHVHHLVYYEQHADISEAIKREKRLKNWSTVENSFDKKGQSWMAGFISGSLRSGYAVGTWILRSSRRMTIAQTLCIKISDTHGHVQCGVRNAPYCDFTCNMKNIPEDQRMSGYTFIFFL